jgi:hypothetical protein
MSFYRFLCETPLKHESLGPSCTSEIGAKASLDDGYDTNITRGGTYHQQYRLCASPDSFDGPLVAVGVVGKFRLLNCGISAVQALTCVYLICTRRYSAKMPFISLRIL